jgi:hypothetical protein
MNKEKTADDYLFVEDTEQKIKFRSMIVPEKVINNDNIQEDKI